MQKHPFNKEASRALFTQCKPGEIQLKQCYLNVAKIVMNSIPSLRKRGWKVAYGYVSSIDGLMVRHAFFIDEHNKAVDPTAMLFTKSDQKERLYYSHTVFEIYEYTQAILDNDGYPDLERPLRKADERSRAWAAEKGLILIG